MTSLTQVGVLYVYLMLVLMALGLGLLALRAIDWLVKWAKNEQAEKIGPNKKIEPSWMRMVYISATVLFLSIFSLGILKTIGAGAGDSHNHGQQAGNQTNNSNTVVIQQQLDQLNYQLFQMEAAMNGYYTNNPNPN